MTTISAEDAVRSVIYVHDLSTMGLEAKLPLSMKDFELTQDDLTEYGPTHEERAAMIAYQSCYFAYLIQNKNGTYDDFRDSVNPEAVQKVTQTIITKIPVPESLPILERVYETESHSMHGQLPIIWDRAEGVQVYDSWGNKWLDFSR